jgi:DivIVA domain-containing protein
LTPPSGDVAGYARGVPPLAFPEEGVMRLFGKKKSMPQPDFAVRLESETERTRPSALTPEDVRNMAFSKPPIGKRGYNEDELDAFLDVVEAALRDPTGRTLTPEQVRNVAFSKPPIGKRGYNEDEVDEFLDLVDEEMRRRATGTNT